MTDDYPAAPNMGGDVPESLLPAVKLLIQHGFTLIEYGSRALPKSGNPIVVSTWEYAISDSGLPSASDLLAEHGFPYISPNPLRIATYGDFEEKGRHHYNVKENPENMVSLRLLPLSITYISLEDLQDIPLDERPAPTIYRLPLPQHCLSLVQSIASYPPGSDSRMKPMFELSALIAYAIFEYKYYTKDWDQPEESEEEYKEKVQFALKKVRSWNLPESTHYWRKLLETLVDGNRQPSDIPYEPENWKLEEQARGGGAITG